MAHVCNLDIVDLVSVIGSNFWLMSWITFREVHIANIGKTRKYIPLKIKIAPKKW
jgi:hypothetical protein